MNHQLPYGKGTAQVRLAQHVSPRQEMTRPIPNASTPSAGVVQSGQGVDMVAVYKMAIENDPQFRGAENDRKALRESLSQAYAHLMPVINGDLVYGRVNQDIVRSSNQVFTSGRSEYDSTNYTLKVTQPLLKWSLFLEVDQAKNLRKRADVDFEFAKQDLIIRVAQAYFTALASKESVTLAKAEKMDIEVLHEKAGVKYKSGIAPVMDLYDARARLALADAQVIKAEGAYRDALQSLQEICAKGVTDLKDLQEVLPMFMPVPDNVDHWVRMGLDRNLKLKSQKYDHEVAKTEVSRQRAGHYPKLDIVGRYNRQDVGGSLFGGGSVVDNKDIMLELNVPLFEGGLILSKTREARERSHKAAEGVERQRRSVIRQINAAYDGIKTAKSRAEALQKSVESQSAILAAKQQGYQSGLYTGLAVLDASRDLHLYRRDYAQSRYDYVYNNLLLKQAIGTLQDDDLVIVNNWLQLSP